MGVWGFVCGFDFDMKNEMLVIIFFIFGMGGMGVTVGRLVGTWFTTYFACF